MTDQTGYAVDDEIGQRYEFPSGFSLSGGDTVTLHTGSETDTSTDLYCRSAWPLRNDSGDTVFVYDDTGSFAIEYPY